MAWRRPDPKPNRLLEDLQVTARLWLMYRPDPLTADQIAELRQQFGARC